MGVQACGDCPHIKTSDCISAATRLVWGRTRCMLAVLPSIFPGHLGADKLRGRWARAQHGVQGIHGLPGGQRGCRVASLLLLHDGHDLVRLLL